MSYTQTQVKSPYENSVKKLKEVLGDDNFRKIEPYLHIYTGKAESVKPVAKHITIYWIGRAEDRMILRTEGEDDIILSEVAGEALRMQWELYSKDIKNVVGDQGYDFLASCSLSPGLAGEGKGAMYGRCMRCPADVLMGATSTTANYNLASRFVGDSAYALTSSYERRTGNAVDEITYTTIMIREGQKTEGFMPSPVELLYVMWMLNRTIRVGARTSIWGTLKVIPVATCVGR